MKPLIIYNYDRVTKEYVGKGEADNNPRDPKNPLMPAFSTTIKPPRIRKKGFKARFIEDEEKWESVVDNRGVYYLTDTGEEIVVDTLNTPLPKGVTRDRRPSTIHAWSNNKWEIDPEKEQLNETEEKIGRKMYSILRRLAIDELIQEGELSESDREQHLNVPIIKHLVDGG